ncbi:MAG TPA: acyl-CoA dehydrogenase family protein [Miltoncostaeaceae bacterium]|nr:acyl-CoA dehydrogenase family protein [Miltoncostaeaceae bacterium]
MTTAETTPAGGTFLVAPCSPEAVFTPERLGDEHRAIGEAVRQFVATQVDPRAEAVEGQDYATHRELLARLGADGYVGVEVPEAHGGAGLDTVTSVIVSESLSAADSFAVTYLAHAGIGTLPLVFFGTEEQRARYLPGLAAGTTVGAYALTEPGSGSDARAMRTTATRLPDGGYRLDGAKQFITNAGFADLFTLYARLSDGGIAAFLVERDAPGLTVGAEEQKMGIKGSSTCPVVLDGVVVPADALLGEPGQGHKIAFNILNVGRFKLAAAALGGMKRSLNQALAYASQREAFGRPIVRFPLVAAKLAGMAARTYAVESVTYRIAGMLDARLEAAGEEAGSEAFRAALEEYAVECSIAKVLGSEELDWTVDQLVQVHGGYGYTAEFPAERAYRDSRINRIWEGTNEINRLLVPGTLVKRAMQGRLDLLGPAKRAADALLGGGADDAPGAGPLVAEDALVAGARTVTLLCAGSAFQRFGAGLEEQQEVLADLADLSIDLFAAESALLRARAAAGRDDAAVHADLARAVVHERAGAIEARARALAGSLGEGDEARMLQSGVRRMMRTDPVDRVALTRRVAERVVSAGGYPA